MATITTGMTIQAAWFNNIDSTGVFKKDVSFLNDSNPIQFVHGTDNLLNVTTVDPDKGSLKLKGSVQDYDPDI